MISQRKKAFIGIIILLSWTFVWASNRITAFEASKENNTITLNWTIEQESGLIKFNIHRKIGQSNWVTIGSVPSKNLTETSIDYSFKDSNIWKTQNSACYYRLEMELQGGIKKMHTIIASASGMSGIRHTWGSLKAMFR
ncbi:hypothetical protein KAR48_10235 [bacterium]|nr:hypothetical protein [bacterium]